MFGYYQQIVYLCTVFNIKDRAKDTKKARAGQTFRLKKT